MDGEADGDTGHHLGRVSRWLRPIDPENVDIQPHGWVCLTPYIHTDKRLWTTSHDQETWQHCSSKHQADSIIRLGKKAVKQILIGTAPETESPALPGMERGR